MAIYNWLLSCGALPVPGEQTRILAANLARYAAALFPVREKLPQAPLAGA